jgi:hypothetical protein
MSRTCALLLALWIGAGCGGSGKPPGGGGSAAATPDAGEPEPSGPPGLDRDYPQLAERAVKLYEDVAELFRAVGEDCEQATAKLGELGAANRDVVTANTKVLREGRARELKQALAKLGDRLDAAAKVIMQSPTISMCAHYPSFTKAFDEVVATPP